jgi:MFS family permease
VLFTGNVVSNVGDWLDLVALLVLVSVVWEAGPGGLAVLSVAITTPVLVAPLLGVLVDRASPRTFMIATDLLRAALTVGLVVATDLWQVALIVFLRAGLGTGFNGAAQVLVRHSVPPDQLVAANSLTQSVVQGVKFVGPAIGGALAAALAPQSVFAINAATFVASAIVLARLRTGRAGAARDEPGSYLHDLADGLRHVAGSRVLGITAITMSVLVFVVFLYDSMAPLAVLGLGLDRAYIGYLLAAVGAGGLVGALAVGQLFRGDRPFLLIGSAVSVIGGAVAVLGLGVVTEVRWGPAPWIAITFLLGVASAGVLVPYPVIVQSVTPEHLIGRTWTTIGALTGVLGILAPTVGAALVTAHGVGRVFVGVGIALLAYGLGVTAAVGRRVVTAPQPRRKEEPPPACVDDTSTHDSTTTRQPERKGAPIMSDNISALSSAGFQLGQASDSQRSIVNSLSDDEVAVLLSVRERIETAAADVEGHAQADGGWFW